MTHYSVDYADGITVAADSAARHASMRCKVSPAAIAFGHSTFAALAYYDTTATRDAARRSACRAACVDTPAAS